MDSFEHSLSMQRMSCSLLKQLLDDRPESQALVMVGLQFLLKLLGSSVPDVLSEHFQLFISLDDLKLEFTNLFLQ